jgi:hypothetical protein
MGRDRYLCLQRMWLTPGAVAALNTASEGMVILPEK